MLNADITSRSSPLSCTPVWLFFWTKYQHDSCLFKFCSLRWNLSFQPSTFFLILMLLNLLACWFYLIWRFNRPHSQCHYFNSLKKKKVWLLRSLFFSFKALSHLDIKQQFRSFLITTLNTNPPTLHHLVYKSIQQCSYISSQCYSISFINSP